MARAAAEVSSDPVVVIETLRQQIADLQAEIAALHTRDVLRPLAEAEELVSKLVAAAAQRARPPIGELLAKRVAPLNRQIGINEVLSLTDKVHPLALISSLFPKKMEEVLLTALRAEYTSDSVVLSTSEQRQREEELQEKCFSLEVEEEALIYELEKAGRPAPIRRADADPAAVLHTSTL